jgi:beta-glucosidase
MANSAAGNGSLGFPAGFLWGAATSAYQVEGCPLADGAGFSNWHWFSHTPGRVRGSETGDLACDHYRRWREDVALLAGLGLNAYRFSIAWSRILPGGVGRLNQAGLDHYRALAEALREREIEPFLTLYHWDLPAELDLRGGWLNPESAKWFAEYAAQLYGALDGSVRYWATVNEPWVVCDAGYLQGVHAPGHRSAFEAVRVSANLLHAHAEAVRAYRQIGRGQVGLVVNLEPKYPASELPADLEATRRADAYMNRQFLDPIFFGHYPAEMKEIFAEAWDDQATDVSTVSVPIDFLGINYYTRSVVAAAASAWPLRAERVRQPGPHTEMDWEVFPQGLFDTLLWVQARYGRLPLYVTENGGAFADPAPVDGELRDPLRVDYYREHLLAVARAVAAGVDVRGYFAWSLLDNFEWIEGYSKRFGIVHVDRQTQNRTIKQSGEFYAAVARTHGRSILTGRG